MMDTLLPETLTNLSPVTLPDLTKQQLLDYADQLVSQYVEDGYDVLRLAALAAKLELLSQRIKEQTKAAALNEVRTYGKGGVSRMGVQLTVSEVGVRYDYSLDPVWRELNQAVADATALRKEQEQLLRKLPYTGRIMVDESTGEEYKAYPPAKSGSESVTLAIQ